MNKTLIVYAHPNKLGHSGYYLNTLIQKLDDKKISYEILDLYEIDYDPKLKAEEHYTSGHKELSDQNKEIQEKIKAAENLVFIFPTWWQATPAILKGFVDRVLVAGYAFSFDEKGLPHGHLGPRKAVVLTSSGSPRWLAKLAFGDRAIKVFVNDTLKFCGLKCKAFSVGNAKELNAQNMKIIEANVSKALMFMSGTN